MRWIGEALAALDMILSVAKLASPPILGGLYAAFVEVGRPEMMFLAAGVSDEAFTPNLD